MDLDLPEEGKPVARTPLTTVTYAGVQVLFFVTEGKDTMHTIEASYRLLRSAKWQAWPKEKGIVSKEQVKSAYNRPKSNTPLAACAVVTKKMSTGRDKVEEKETVAFLYHINKSGDIIRIILRGLGATTEFHRVQPATDNSRPKRPCRDFEISPHSNLAAVALRVGNSKNRIYCQLANLSVQELICVDDKGWSFEKGKNFGPMMLETGLAVSVVGDGDEAIITAYMQDANCNIVEFRCKNNAWTSRICVPNAPMQTPLAATQFEAYNHVFLHSDTTINHIKDFLEIPPTYIEGMIDEACRPGSRVAVGITKKPETMKPKSRKPLSTKTKPGSADREASARVAISIENDDDDKSVPSSSGAGTSQASIDSSHGNDAADVGGIISEDTGKATETDEAANDEELRIFYQASPDLAITEIVYRADEELMVFNDIPINNHHPTGLLAALGPRKHRQRIAKAMRNVPEPSVAEPAVPAAPPAIPAAEDDDVEIINARPVTQASTQASTQPSTQALTYSSTQASTQASTQLSSQASTQESATPVNTHIEPDTRMNESTKKDASVAAEVASSTAAAPDQVDEANDDVEMRDVGPLTQSSTQAAATPANHPVEPDTRMDESLEQDNSVAGDISGPEAARPAKVDMASDNAEIPEGRSAPLTSIQESPTPGSTPDEPDARVLSSIEQYEPMADGASDNVADMEEIEGMTRSMSLTPQRLSRRSNRRVDGATSAGSPSAFRGEVPTSSPMPSHFEAPLSARYTTPAPRALYLPALNGARNPISNRDHRELPDEVHPLGPSEARGPIFHGARQPLPYGQQGSYEPDQSLHPGAHQPPSFGAPPRVFAGTHLPFPHEAHRPDLYEAGHPAHYAASQAGLGPLPAAVNGVSPFMYTGVTGANGDSRMFGNGGAGGGSGFSGPPSRTYGAAPSGSPAAGMNGAFTFANPGACPNRILHNLSNGGAGGHGGFAGPLSGSHGHGFAGPPSANHGRDFAGPPSTNYGRGLGGPPSANHARDFGGPQSTNYGRGFDGPPSTSYGRGIGGHPSANYSGGFGGPLSSSHGGGSGGAPSVSYGDGFGGPAVVPQISPAADKNISVQSHTAIPVAAANAATAATAGPPGGSAANAAAAPQISRAAAASIPAQAPVAASVAPSAAVPAPAQQPHRNWQPWTDADLALLYELRENRDMTNQEIINAGHFPNRNANTISQKVMKLKKANRWPPQ